MTEQRFSDRHGFAPKEAEITIRHEVPRALRALVADFAYAIGLKPGDMREIACRELMEAPDEGNWSEFPNIDYEVRGLLRDCEWFEVYDIIEAVCQSLDKPFFEKGALEKFESEVNRFFVKKGVGWRLRDCKLEVRGPEVFEATVRQAKESLQDSQLRTASREIHEALQDLGRRPEPDLTGAIQHAMAAAECVAREAVGESSPTLGRILNRYPDLVPRPLNEALSKMWGFASQVGRHLEEGREPSYEDAEFVVTISAGVVTYLEKRLRAR